jgi:hypothetical protein
MLLLGMQVPSLVEHRVPRALDSGVQPLITPRALVVYSLSISVCRQRRKLRPSKRR